MPLIDRSVQSKDGVTRCPRCGKRVDAGMTACPACSYELLPHRSRITCRRCSSRVPADSVTCPRCGEDPRRGPIPPIVPRIAAIVVGVFLVVCIGWVIFRAVTTNILGRAFNLGEPTPAPTLLVQVIYVLATPAPPTLAPRPTNTPPKPTTPSPTRRGARAVSTPTLVPSPVATPYPMVALLAPAHTTVYSGANSVIVLEWRSVAPDGLKENEWYEIKVVFTGRDGVTGERKSYTKETRWTISADLYKDVSPEARTFRWGVNVVRVDGMDPLASLNRTPISAAGTTRLFIWN